MIKMNAYTSMTTAIAELLDFDPEITSQIKKMLERSHFIYDWSSFMIELVCEPEALKFEDENGILIDIPPSILDKLSVLKMYTSDGNGTWVAPRNSSRADLLNWCNKDQRKILAPETMMTGQFKFDMVLAYILLSDMHIRLDIDCNFRRILRSYNIHDCRSFAKAIEMRHYKRWNIVDTPGVSCPLSTQWIIFKLDRYHEAICAHNTDVFYNSWEQEFQQERERIKREEFERLETERREEVERLERERIEKERLERLEKERREEIK